MKYILIMLLFVSVARAEDCSDAVSSSEVKEQMEIKTDVPKYLEGATIIVRLKDGKESVVPAEKFKVVPRKQQYLVTKVQNDIVRMCKSNLKNRLSVVAGSGPNGKLYRSSSGSYVKVENEQGLVGGVQYQRQTGIVIFGKEINAGLLYQDNSTFSGTAGFDY